VLAQTVVRASARGYGEAVRSAERHARGVRAWAVEGAGHYGAGLTRDLGERGETVPSRSAAKLAGAATARQRRPTRRDSRWPHGLAAETLTLPRSAVRQEALRVVGVSVQWSR